MSLPTARERRRRALAHQCPQCRRHWALRLVEHPAGTVVVCRHCAAVNRVVDPSTAARGLAHLVAQQDQSAGTAARP